MLGRMLIVEDDIDLLSQLSHRLSHDGFEVRGCPSAEDAISALRQGPYDAVVSDIQLGEMDGIQLCGWVRQNRPGVPVVVMTGYGTMDVAVSALRAGAHDFVTKPVDLGNLKLVLERALQQQRLHEEVKRLQDPVVSDDAMSELLGTSAAMKRIRELVKRVADTDSSILVTGESGTGKELVARAIHESSRRRSHPFVAVNCAAVPETLLESELFGHARGAFTDARNARPGLFMRANEGTLFLDEIGDMPLGLQPKLLRALQEKQVRPVGGEGEQAFDARLIAATNKDLEAACAEGHFRSDLYFRINVIPIELPPLRAREQDALLLAQHFVSRYAKAMGKPVTGLSSAAALRVLEYEWPGNVRELSNAMERAVALARNEEIMVDDLSPRVRGETGTAPTHAEAPAPAAESDLTSLETVEKSHILRVLRAVGGNKSVAARVLGLDRKTLYRKLDQYR